MSHADFVHLRVHSAYSLSEGAIKVKDLIKLCKKEKMPAVAITDTGNLFGALEFATASADEGIQPIIGAQLQIKRTAAPIPGRATVRSEPDQLVLLAQNAARLRQSHQADQRGLPSERRGQYRDPAARRADRSDRGHHLRWPADWLALSVAYWPRGSARRPRQC